MCVGNVKLISNFNLIPVARKTGRIKKINYVRCPRGLIGD